MSQFRKNLQIIHSFSKHLSNERKQSLINCFSFKTNKIQIMFENISDPFNVHACVRTAMNFGINTIHLVQNYDDLFSSYMNGKNKVNSGTIKWMDIKLYSTMNEFVNNLNSKYDPIFISTDISSDSKNVLELSKILQGVIDPFKEENKIKSDEILENMLLCNMTKEKIQSLKLKYENDDSFKYDNFKNLQNFLENLYFNEKFLEGMKRENSEKKKVVILIFGNESRGISSVVRKLSHHKIMIPHFGMANTSYNISVACSMILFHMYSTGFLPGTFIDFNAEEGVDILKRKIVNSFPGLNREKIKLIGIDEYLDDF